MMSLGLCGEVWEGTQHGTPAHSNHSDGGEEKSFPVAMHSSAHSKKSSNCSTANQSFPLFGLFFFVVVIAVFFPGQNDLFRPPVPAAAGCLHPVSAPSVLLSAWNLCVPSKEPSHFSTPKPSSSKLNREKSFPPTANIRLAVLELPMLTNHYISLPQPNLPSLPQPPGPPLPSPPRGLSSPITAPPSPISLNICPHQHSRAHKHTPHVCSAQSHSLGNKPQQSLLTEHFLPAASPRRTPPPHPPSADSSGTNSAYSQTPLPLASHLGKSGICFLNFAFPFCSSSAAGTQSDCSYDQPDPNSVPGDGDGEAGQVWAGCPSNDKAASCFHKPCHQLTSPSSRYGTGSL